MENVCQSDLKTQEMALLGVKMQQFPWRAYPWTTLKPWTFAARMIGLQYSFFLDLRGGWYLLLSLHKLQAPVVQSFFSNLCKDFSISSFTSEDAHPNHS